MNAQKETTVTPSVKEKLAVGKSNPLAAIVESEIQRKGQISFDRYVQIWHDGEIDPNDCSKAHGGFYHQRDLLIGDRDGEIDLITNDQAVDFMTYPESTPLFGFMLAQKIIALREKLGNPDDFKIIEMGAGNGTLAKDIINGLKYFQSEFPVDFVIVENSTSLIAKQKKALKGLGVKFIHGSALEALPQNVTGVFLSNELIDDLPSKLITRGEDGKLKEAYIKNYDDAGFEEVWGEPSPDAQVFLDKYKPFIDDENPVVPINLNAEKLMQKISASLKRGFVITIDYPFGRSDSILNSSLVRTYSASHRGGKRSFNGKLDYFTKENVGKGNITTSVDFAVLSDIGKSLGFSTVEDCLVGDMVDKFNYRQIYEELSGKSEDEIREILGGRKLRIGYMDNSVMNNGFQVLIQGKNI